MGEIIFLYCLCSQVHVPIPFQPCMVRALHRIHLSLWETTFNGSPLQCWSLCTTPSPIYCCNHPSIHPWSSSPCYKTRCSISVFHNMISIHPSINLLMLIAFWPQPSRILSCVKQVCDFGLSRLKHRTFLSTKSGAGTVRVTYGLRSTTPHACAHTRARWQTHAYSIALT